MTAPPSPAPEGRARLLRGACLALAVFWLAAPSWPDQLDDQLITLAFAHEWAASGLIRWGTGAVVEACSSFLQLALATTWIALGGPDANVFVKVLAMLAGLLLVFYANARLPLTFAGTLLLAALVGWEPTARWTAVGMETSLYALLLTVGWTSVLGAPFGTAAGLGALWLAATAHPEGNVHFALAALLALRTSGRARSAALLFGLALAVWHLLRVGAFGALLPTPYLVKIAANATFGAQWGQFAWEAVTLAGVAAALLTGFRVRAIALLPVLVQAAVALRAEADWMGHARHLFPGVWATAVCWGATAGLGVTPIVTATNAEPTVRPGYRPPSRHREGGPLLAPLLAVAVVLAASLFEPPSPFSPRPMLRDARILHSPLRWYRSALDTTQREDVERIVEGVPPGGSVILEDVGMAGNVPGVRVIDLVGLADRDIALAAIGDDDADTTLRLRMQGPPDRPALVRRMIYAADELPRPVPWLRLPAPQRVPYPQGTALWYRLTDARPTDEDIARRWRMLHERYPSQGPVAWYHAVTEADQGRLLAAAAIADRVTGRFPRDPLLRALPAALFAPMPMESYATPPDALGQTSRPIPRALAASLAVVLAVEPDLDEAQLVDVSWACGGPASRVVARGHTRAPLPPWTCRGDEARLRVEAVDDRPARALPEQLYVGLGLLP